MKKNDSLKIKNDNEIEKLTRSNFDLFWHRLIIIRNLLAIFAFNRFVGHVTCSVKLLNNSHWTDR